MNMWWSIAIAAAIPIILVIAQYHWEVRRELRKLDQEMPVSYVPASVLIEQGRAEMRRRIEEARRRVEEDRD